MRWVSLNLEVLYSRRSPRRSLSVTGLRYWISSFKSSLLPQSNPVKFRFNETITFVYYLIIIIDARVENANIASTHHYSHTILVQRENPLLRPQAEERAVNRGPTVAQRPMVDGLNPERMGHTRSSRKLRGRPHPTRLSTERTGPHSTHDCCAR